MYQSDAQHSGRSPHVGPRQVILLHSTLYFGANKGGTYALNRLDGTLKWQFPIVGSVYSSPALDATGTLYTGSTLGHVLALHSESGHLIFDYDRARSGPRQRSVAMDRCSSPIDWAA
jgi:outer membrane protein assembly factor BamB